VLVGYLWFFIAAGYVYDLRDTRKQVMVVSALAAVVATAILLFGVILEWI